MRKVFYILLIFVFSSTVKSQWQPDIWFVNSTGYNSLSNSVAASNNLVHAVWHDFRNSTWEIYYKRSSDGGLNWEPDLRLTNNFGQSDNPSIYASGSDVYVVWHDNSDGNFEIYFKHSSDGGINWSSDTRLTYDNSSSLHPNIYVSGSIIHVVWHESRDGNLEIYFKRSTNNGVSWETDTRLTNNSAQSEFSSISGSASNVNLVWRDNRDGNYEIYFKRSTNNGISWSSDVRITNDLGISQSPCISVSGSKEYIVWEDNRFGNSQIFYKNSTDGGLNWGIETELSSNSSTSLRPSIVSSGAKTHVAWYEVNSHSIFYKYSPNSGLTWNPNTNLTTTASGICLCTGPSITAAGDAVHIVWTDYARIFYKGNPIQNSSYTILTSPNGGENYYSGTLHNLNWIASISNIKIELTTNNGNTWSTINSNYPADSGKYSWTVPNLFSSQCKIKISDASNPSIYDVSDSNFTISQATPASALDFDGIYDYVQLPDSLTSKACSNKTAITIEYWFKGSNIQSAVRFQNGNGFLVAGWNGLHIISSDGSVENGLPVGAAATDGNWHHVAMTWEKSTINGFNSYLDGNLVASRNSANANLPNIIYGGFLGCYGGGSEFMTGKLDEVRIWNRALSQAEIQQSMNCEIPTTNYGLIANYHFNQGIVNENNSGVTTLTDFSGNLYNGSLNNFALTGSSSNWVAPGGIVNGYNCNLDLSLLKPNGGEKWYNGHSNEIVWNSSGISNIKIQYSINNGSTWNTITSSYPAAQYLYSWNIPSNVNSLHSKIKISDASNPNVYDVSDSSFSITLTTLNSGLVVYYPFDSNFNDATGNGFNGTPDGNPTFVPGVLGNSVKFVGDPSNSCVYYSGGDRIRMPLINFYSMPSFTISMWVYDSLVSCGIETYFFQGDDWAPGSNMQITNYFDTYAVFAVGNIAQQQNQALFVPYRLEDKNRFVLYTVTYSNGSFQAYRNSEYLGSFLQDVSYSSTYSGLASHAWYGGSATSARFHGKIDDFRIYDRALSQNEIQELFDQNSTTLSIVSPMSGESLQAGSTKYISWNIQGNISQLKIDFSSNNGTSWTNLSPSWNTTYNTYPWHVPNISSDECKIRLSNTTNQSVSVTSGKFTISGNDITERLTFKIKDPLSLSNRIRLIQNSGNYKEGNIVNGKCSFKKLDLTGLLLNPIKEIQILNSNMVVGHIDFEYKWSEYNSNKKVEAILYVDSSTASEVGYYENPEWKYFSNSNEHLVYMLIPPFEKIDSVRYFKKPLLFVHGFTDTYPNWDKLPDSLNYEYNGWQLYYPNDMGISHCSKILKKALYNILSGDAIGAGSYGGQKMNVVAYSMGGLVSRNYIQSLYYSNDINKLLMLGVPNNGSLSTYCLRHEGLKGLLGKKLGKDENSPASIDLSSGSSFLNSLNNNSDPKVLFNNNIKQSYLVIAGTKYYWKLAGLHHESKKQEDGVVSVSSASLLNKGIPLAIVNLDHTELPHQISVDIINSFFKDTYNPVNGINFINNINGFWLDQGSMIFNEDNDLDMGKGILYLGMNGVDINLRNIQLINPSQHSFFIDFNSAIMSPLASLNFNPENKSIYFTRRSGYRGEIGLDLNSNSNPIVSFTFGKTVPSKVGEHLISTYKPIARRLFYYYSLQTNWIDMNFTASELFHINGYTRINNNLALQRTLKDNSYDKTNSQNTYYIDNSIDTISFYLSSDSNDVNFQNNNFKLYDPNNTMIDSNYANQYPNVEFEQDLNESFAYYYIVNPTPGNWTVEYNPNLSNTFLDVPIQSHIVADLRFPDTSYVAGDSIKFTVSLSKPIDYTNIQLTSKITCIPNYNYPVQDLGQVNLYQINDSTYEGKFLSTSAGEYLAELDFNCLYNNENVQRKNYASKNVITLKPPVTVFPRNDSLFTPQNLRFKWNKSRNATRYQLIIYQLGDTIPSFIFSDIPDTLYRAEGLIKQTSYLWKVRASFDKDSSSWSVPKVFTTTVDPPTSPDLDSPPDNSGGLTFPLSFNWLNSSGATKYHFQISSDTSFGNIVLNDSLVSDTALTINNLPGAGSYYWRVKAVNEGGVSEFSDHWSFRIIEGSFIKIKLTPEGLYNVSANNLQRRDTIKCYLMNSSSPFSIVDSSTTVLDSVSFEALFEFRNALPGTYYLKLNYKNLIETWSVTGGEIFTVSDTLIYDFTSSQSRAFGNNLTLKNTIWCIYSGDINQDANIDLTDLVSIFNDANIFTTGYVTTDLTGDYITDLTDLIIAYNNSSNFVSVVRP